jgi:ribosomal protein S18 acetylase RimI-like enzyme
MDVRELDLADTHDVVALWHAAGLTRPWNDPADDLHRALAAPSATVFGAFDGDRLVGTVMTGEDGHRGWLYYLAVAEDRRGDGLGRDLVTAAEAWLAGRDVVKVNLMVRGGNEVALGFYDRLGWTREDTVVLSRWLRPPTDPVT